MQTSVTGMTATALIITIAAAILSAGCSHTPEEMEFARAKLEAQERRQAACDANPTCTVTRQIFPHGVNPNVWSVWVR